MKKELDPKTSARFEKWLRTKGYAERTVHKYSRDLAACVRYNGEPPNAKRRRSRIIDYKLAYEVFQSAELGVLPVKCPVVPPLERFGGKRSRDPKRVYEAVSFPKEDYMRIVSAAEKRGDVQSLVLVVVARTGLRITDVLRAPLGDVRRAMKREDGIVTLVVKGGDPETFCVRNGGAAERAWRALLDHADCRRAPDAWHFAAAMTGDPDAKAEAQYAAYERVRKTLTALGKESKVSGRVHLHRFRRSVGVYLAVAGKSVDQIAKTFGQKPGSTATRRYIDEARSLESARLLREIE